MKIREVIKQLQKIEQEYGNVSFHIYKTFSQSTSEPTEVHYDDTEKDAYVSVYA